MDGLRTNVLRKNLLRHRRIVASDRFILGVMHPGIKLGLALVQLFAARFLRFPLVGPSSWWVRLTFFLGC
jgi:hypothetical protein